ncbi:MAG: hypothetical protein H6R16_1604 [Proteobacteria bacterium]|nr:hypothetical protein [Pseudomonadota bacterium]
MLQKRFSDQELEQIIEEATIYMCACPAQVVVQIRGLRELFRYQLSCEIDPGNDPAVHQAIAEVTTRAHAMMEECLDQILTMEGWDRTTLKMPEGLRRKLSEAIERDV